MIKKKLKRLAFAVALMTSTLTSLSENVKADEYENAQTGQNQHELNYDPEEICKMIRSTIKRI